jgi:peroxiredoxin
MKKLVTMTVIPALMCTGILASAQDRPGGTQDPNKDRMGQQDRMGQGQQDRMNQRDQQAGVQVGAQAPNFILQDVDGETHNLREYLQDDKIVVLEWFDPLSPFSRKYHEQNEVMKQTYERFEDKDVVWLAVTTFGIQDQGRIGGQQPGQIPGQQPGQTPGQQPGQTPGQTGQTPGQTGQTPGATGQGETSRLATMNRDQAVQILERAKDDLKIDYPILLDEAGNLAKLYGVKEIPHIFIINKDGRVAYYGAIDNSRGLAQGGDVNYVSQALNQLVNNQPVSVPTSQPFGTSLPASAPREGADQNRSMPPGHQPHGGEEDKGETEHFGGERR